MIENNENNDINTLLDCLEGLLTSNAIFIEEEEHSEEPNIGAIVGLSEISALAEALLLKLKELDLDEREGVEENVDNMSN